jgi:hypothetical protein
MSCSISDIQGDILSRANSKLLSAAKGFKEIGPGVYESRVAKNLSLEKLYERGAAGQIAVANWAEGLFGPKFKFGWVKMDRSHPKRIRLNMDIPVNLNKAIEVKLGLKSVSQANNELQAIEKQAKEVSQDTSLDIQNFQSDNDFYNEVGEVFPTIDLQRSDILSEAEYRGNQEFHHNKSLDQNVRISDEQLYKLINDNIC